MNLQIRGSKESGPPTVVLWLEQMGEDVHLRCTRKDEKTGDYTLFEITSEGKFTRFTGVSDMLGFSLTKEGEIRETK